MTADSSIPDPVAALDPASAAAIADQVLDGALVPKKVPAVDDIDGQTSALTGALASALLTAQKMPVHVLQPFVADVAKQLVALGIRQTEHVDPNAVHAPAWITDGVKQQAAPVPPQPDPMLADPAEERTAVAPEMPKRIPVAARAVRQQ